jgi:hypothetical protein
MMFYALRKSRVLGVPLDPLGGSLVNTNGDFRAVLTEHAKGFADMCGGASVEALAALVDTCSRTSPAECLDDGENGREVYLGNSTSVKFTPALWPVEVESVSPYCVDCDVVDSTGESVRWYGREVLTVRRHSDGRTLVHGGGEFIDEFARQFNILNPSGGAVVPVGQGRDVPAIVRRVGKTLGLEPFTIQNCVNGLPAEELR